MSIQPMIDLAAMNAELIRDEANRLTVYDDATGLPIKPGTHVIGHPTIGTGRSLDIDGITTAESQVMRENDIARYLIELGQLDWFRAMDPARRRAIVNMRHQLGLNGLMAFHMMIAAIDRGEYDIAGDAAKASIWYQQEQPEAGKPARVTRADRVIALLRHGDDPPPAAAV